MKKLVVITGASSGIGKELALCFSKKGYPLLLLARRLEPLTELNLPNTICKSVDVQDLKAFESAVRFAENTYGKTDLLINNAGIMPLGKIFDMNIEQQYQMVDINVKGVLNGMHIVINDMKERLTGTIINISSVAGRWTSENRAIYNGTKFAVHAISEQARKELAPYNVRVTTIAPALVDTNLISNTVNKDSIETYNEWKSKLDGGLKPSIVADMILYTYELPQSVAVRELVISSTKQPV